MSIFERFVQKGADIGQAGQRMLQLSAFTSQLQSGEQEDLARYPQDAGRMKPFYPKLKEALERYRGRSRTKEETGLAPVNAAVKFFLSDDRMSAYACLLPPMDGGKDMDEETFWAELRYEGISSGLLREEAREYIGKKAYLHLFPIARGTPPRDGADGGVTDLFQRVPPLSIETCQERTMDFSVQRPVIIIHKGDAICDIRFPVAGVNGEDVTGHPLSCREGAAPEVPQGKNTELSPDGSRLVAGIDGILYEAEGRFCVRMANVLAGPVTETKADFDGDLFIDGDVLEGTSITADGGIFIQGEVHGASIRAAAGSIRVQAGIKGGASVEAAGQVQAPSIADSAVSAGGNVYAEVIVDSNVTSGGSVFVNGGRGLILGGEVKARNRIVCIQLGNVSGKPGKLVAGYLPEVFREMGELEEALASVQDTLEKLRKSIGNLRMGGETLSLEKRALLAQLTEQRGLYEKREATLTGQQKEAREKLRSALSGKVLCQELYPPVTVQIGDRTKEFTLQETNCNIHVYAGQVVAK